jgi:hypothetical protein
MAATEYIIFGKIVQAVGHTYSPIKRRVTALFLSFDILSLIVQGAGGSLFASSNRDIITPARAIVRFYLLRTSN